MRLSLGIIALVPLTLAAQEQASKPATPAGSFGYGHKTAVPAALAARRSTAIPR